MYGLNDAPLAWQLVLSDYWTRERGATDSAFDECFFMWMDKPGQVRALGSAHVDDQKMGSDQTFLDKEFKLFATRFGGATRSTPPFTHTGVHYSITDRGRKMDQDEFCQKLKPFLHS